MFRGYRSIERAKLCAEFQKSILSILQHQTTSRRRQHFDLFYLKRNAEFNEISFFFLKATGSVQKIAKTKVIWKNTNGRRSEAKG